MLIEINSNVEECPFRTLFDDPGDRFHACGVLVVRCEREVPAMCPLLYGPVIDLDDPDDDNIPF